VSENSPWDFKNYLLGINKVLKNLIKKFKKGVSENKLRIDKLLYYIAKPKICMECSKHVCSQGLDQQDINVPLIIKRLGWIVRRHEFNHHLRCFQYRCRPRRKCTPADGFFGRFFESPEA